MINNNLQLIGSYSTLQKGRIEQSNKELALSFNKRQSELYGRLLGGLKFYDKVTLSNMNKFKKAKIFRLSLKAHKEINLFKQQVMVAITDGFTQHLFGEKILSSELDPKFRCTLSLKELGLTKRDIVDLLIAKKILPHNFYEIV